MITPRDEMLSKHGNKIKIFNSEQSLFSYCHNIKQHKLNLIMICRMYDTQYKMNIFRNNDDNVFL